MLYIWKSGLLAKKSRRASPWVTKVTDINFWLKSEEMDINRNGHQPG